MKAHAMERASRKYFKLAGDAGFVDKPRFASAGMSRAADLAKQIHDLAYELGAELERKAGEEMRKAGR